ncbi:MAG: ester cyclase [Saprospiraceae bacterium]|nr:ester cyclase [Saprospiraceae bacterium]
MKGLPAAINNATELALKMMANVSAHDLEGVTRYCAADARFNGWGPQPLDSKGYRQAMTEILASFPDATFTVYDVVSEGDKVVVRHQLEGTHTGATFQGIPQSNRKIKVLATVTFYFNNGQAQELWLNADMLGLLMQLSANPLAKN